MHSDHGTPRTLPKQIFSKSISPVRGRCAKQHSRENSIAMVPLHLVITCYFPHLKPIRIWARTQYQVIRIPAHCLVTLIHIPVHCLLIVPRIPLHCSCTSAARLPYVHFCLSETPLHFGSTKCFCLHRFPFMADSWINWMQCQYARWRLGAVLCRDEAQKLWKLKDVLAEKGVSIVGVIHERIPDEVSYLPTILPFKSCIHLSVAIRTALHISMSIRSRSAFIYQKAQRHF